MNESEIYELIDKELSGGGLIRSLWLRLYAEADGDEGKAKARYIKERAAQLMATKQQDELPNDIAPVASTTREKLTYVVYPKPLTKGELAELEKIETAALENVGQKHQKLLMMLAGMSASDGGRQKVVDQLKQFYVQFLQAAQEMPKSVNPGSDEDILAISQIDATATFYLAVDACRHRTPKVAFFANKQQHSLSLAQDDQLDRIAWTAANYLRMVRTFLKN